MNSALCAIPVGWRSIAGAPQIWAAHRMTHLFGLSVPAKYAVLQSRLGNIVSPTMMGVKS